ncbi:hypothetical protein MMC19_001073 [Ptychographa xylographoides]|nr:hypothetical protein [Ptychographa xylographoides]
MPPLRSLTRHLPRPSITATTNPSIISISTYPLRPALSTTAIAQSSIPVAPAATVPFSTSSRALAADHGAHESHYDPPSGWLFGIPPGETYKKEGWENVWVYGFWGSLGLAVVAYAYKPDTS